MLFSKTFPRPILDSWGPVYPVCLRLDPSPADMFSCCCFCSGKFKSFLTEHLSRPPLLPPLPSESSYLLSCIIPSASYRFFLKSLLSSQRSITSLVTLTSLRMDLTHRKKQLVKLTNSFYFVFKNIRFWYGYVLVSLIVCFFQCWMQCLLCWPGEKIGQTYPSAWRKSLSKMGEPSEPSSAWENKWALL